MDKKERDEKIELYGRGYEMLVEALKEIPREMWQWKPEPKEWSVHEVIIHLADSETNSALRARKLIVEPGDTAIMAYDQNKWAIELDYHSQNIEDALATLHWARTSTYQLLKRFVTDEVFTHALRHPENPDPYTFEKWLTIYARHIPGHIDQIRKNYELWQKAKG